MGFHKIKLRQPRVYKIDDVGFERAPLHSAFKTFMSANGYTDGNRAYMLSVGKENVVENGDDYYRVSLPFPKAKDNRGIMLISKDSVFESDAIGRFSGKKCYDIDLGERNAKHSVVYTDEDGNRASEYVAASTVERYMNFADAAYVDGFNVASRTTQSAFTEPSATVYEPAVADVNQNFDVMRKFNDLHYEKDFYEFRYWHFDDEMVSRIKNGFNNMVESYYNPNLKTWNFDKMRESIIQDKSKFEEAMMAKCVEHKEDAKSFNITGDTYDMYASNYVKGLGDGLCCNMFRDIGVLEKAPIENGERKLPVTLPMFSSGISLEMLKKEDPVAYATEVVEKVQAACDERKARENSPSMSVETPDDDYLPFPFDE